MGSFILLANGSQICRMKTCSEIRLENLLTIIERAGSLQEVADKLEKSHAQISQLKTQAKHSKTGKPRLIGDDTARLVEQRFGLEVGWMDNVHSQTSATTTSANSPNKAWPFDIAPERLQALNPGDWARINATITATVEAREADMKRNGKAA